METEQTLLMQLRGAPCMQCMHRVPTLASAQSAGKILPFREMHSAEACRPVSELGHVISTLEWLVPADVGGRVYLRNRTWQLEMFQGERTSWDSQAWKQ